MNIDVKVIDSEKELLSPCWYGNEYRQRVIDRKTFYVYRFTNTGIVLFIVDGLKTDPPLSPVLFEYDKDEYNKTYTIPKGIIHMHHSDHIDPNHLENIKIMDSLYVALERNDEVAIEKYKEFILEKIEYFKSLHRKDNYEIKKYKSVLDNIK